MSNEDDKLKQQCADRKAKRQEMKKKRGRPTKKEIEAKKKGNRGKVGRPAGDAAVINEFKARLLASPKTPAVMNSIMEAALNDEHKHQAAAWKLIMDRVAPHSYYEKDKLSGGRNAIQINITGVDGATITSPAATPQEEADAIDGDYDEVQDD